MGFLVLVLIYFLVDAFFTWLNKGPGKSEIEPLHDPTVQPLQPPSGKLSGGQLLLVSMLATLVLLLLLARRH